MTIAELIAALESATGPSRKLEAAIMEAAGLVNEAHCKNWCAMDGRTDLTRARYLDAWALDFTRSVDHALELLPDGCWYLIGKGRNSPAEPIYGAVVHRAGADLHAPDPIGEGEHNGSLALALCIAALRARQHEAAKQPAAT